MRSQNFINKVAEELVKRFNGRVHIQSVMREMAEENMNMDYLPDVEDAIQELGGSIYTD